MERPVKEKIKGAFKSFLTKVNSKFKKKKVVDDMI